MKKKRKLLPILCTLAMGISATFAFTACKDSYTTAETDTLISQLQSTIDSNKSELEGKITVLTEEYKAKDSELLAQITANQQAIAAMQTEYAAKIAVLELADETNAKAISDLKTEYLAKIEELIASDNENSTALSELKTTYETKVAELEKADSNNKKAITELENEYLAKVEELAKADSDNATALAELKSTYESKVAALEKADSNNKKAITELENEYLAKVEELAKADSDNATALAELKSTYESKVAALEKADSDNKQAIANLTSEYAEKVEELENKIAQANETIASNKTALEKSIESLKTAYETKVDELETLIITIQNTDKEQNDKITELEKQVADLMAVDTYTVTFDSNGGTAVAAQTVNEYEKITRPEDPTKDGYIFKGWYIDNEQWLFAGASLTENITLTAKWQEEYDFSGITFENAVYTYDGTEKTLAINGTLPASDLTVIYNNNALTNAGTANATAQIVDGEGYVHTTLNAMLTIEKATLTFTMDDSASVYDGTRKNLTINEALPDGVSVSYSNNNQINAGKYSVVASFTVNGNYNSIDDITSTLTIEKAPMNIRAENTTYVYDGTQKNVNVIKGNIPDSDKVGLTLVNDGKTDAGSYAVTVKPYCTENYVVENEYTVTLTVLPAEITITADDKTSVYGETLKTLTYTLDGLIYNNDFTPTLSKTTGLNAGSYEIAVSAEHKNYKITIVNGTYTVKKAVYDMSGISFPNASYTYDGNEKTIVLKGTLPDGVEVSYTNNSGVNANTYTAIANFVGDERNYEAIDSMTATLVINKATYDMSKVRFNDTTYTYDGLEKSLVLVGALPAGLSATYSNNTLTNVGTVYASVSFNGDYENYYQVGVLSALLTVEKATYDMSQIAFVNTTVVYNGEEHTFELSGELPDGVFVSYDDNAYTNAGEYTVIASFTGDYDNYHEIPDMQTVVVIKKATYDMSAVVFDGATFDYDGTMKTIALSGELPDGVEYELFNNSKTNAGTYTATACFTGDTVNHETIPDMTATLVINKISYDMSGVSFVDGETTYDGGEKSLAITGELPDGVSVSYVNNAQRNAGQYTVTAKFTGDSKNYNAIEDKTAVLTIEKATPVLNVSYNSENFSLHDTLVLNANTPVEGTIALNDGQTLVIGTKNYAYTFKPVDTDNYNEVSGTISITVYAKVRFENIDGEALQTQYVKKGELIQEFTPVYADDSGYAYTFVGWKLGEEEFASDTQILTDTVLTADYSTSLITYAITYVLNDGTAAETLTENYTVLDRVSIPTMSKTGYTFDGWSGETLTELSKSFVFENEIGNRTYTANFTANTYTVAFDTDGGDCDTEEMTVSYDSEYTLPTPKYFGYDFLGWYDGEELFENGVWDRIENVSLVAKWQHQDQIKVSTASDLTKVAYDLSGNYILMNEISLAGAEWAILGDESNPFTGTFDGNGYTVLDFTITVTADYTGLFGVNNGTIKNLSITGASVSSGTIGAAILVAKNSGTIENCSVNGTVAVKNTYVGGLIAYNTGSVAYSNSMATVSGGTYIGGLVGYQNGGTVAYSYTTGEISCDKAMSYVGGLVGYVENGVALESCYSSATVNATSAETISTVNVGGLVGYSVGTSELNNTYTGCYFTGNISVDVEYTGTGNDGNKSELTSKVGGLVGYGEYSAYLQCYASGTATVAVQKTGSRDSSSPFGNYHYDVYSYCGGLIGYSIHEEIENCYNSTELSNKVYATSYYYSYRSGSASTQSCVNAYSYIGGLVGYVNNGTIINSYASGDMISATTAVATYNDSYFANTATCYSYVGGLIGYVSSSTTTTNCYASIEVFDISASASAYTEGRYTIDNLYGGFAGLSTTNLTATNCYRYSGTESNVETGTSTTLANLQSIEFITGTLGWDSTVWNLKNGTYPTLTLYSAE